jgi:hypothetical protein
VVAWFAAVLIIVAVALFIAAPLSDSALGDGDTDTDHELQQCKHQHALAVQALRDLEFDHAMGKLDDHDYRALRNKLENRALAAMSRPGAHWQVSPGIPSRVEPISDMPFERVPARVVSVNFCPQCGTRSSVGQNFCANCGTALAVASLA